MLVTLGLVALLAGQPAADVRSPYFVVVRQYGPGTERRAARGHAGWQALYPRAPVRHVEALTGLADTGRRLLIWTLQLQADEITCSPTTATSGWHAIDISATGRHGADVRARRGHRR